MSEPAREPSEPAERRAAGVIHDLGYARYTGARRPMSTRWRAIARHHLTTAWQTWWRYRAALAIAAMVTVAFGGMMYFLADSSMFRGFRSVGALPLTIADGALPASIQWYRRSAFVFTLTMTAGAIAGDRQSGAFSLYVARSTRPIDYILGKLAATLALTAPLALLCPLVLATLRLGLFDDNEQLVAHLVILPKIPAIGALSTLAYSIVPLGVSALFATRRQALQVWCAYWLVATSILALLGAMTSGWIAAFDLPSALDSITNQLFHLYLPKRLQMSLTVAVASVLGHVLVALALFVAVVRRQHRAGIRGHS